MPPNLHDIQPPAENSTALFDDIERRVERYVHLGVHERAVVVAFIVHCHAIDAFYTTPRIKITSPEENCGKTLLAVDVAGALLPAGSILSVSITPAALYRKLGDTTPPAFVLDEFDNTLGRKGAIDSETQSTLLAVLNSGYKRGATVSRCVPPSYESRDFPVFAPVIVSGIRPDLRPAFESRTIPIEMLRPLPDEYPEEFEFNEETATAGDELRDRIADWAAENLDRIRAIRPERADGIVGRKAECWVPLLTVAEAADGQWPERLREAATALALNGQVGADGSYSHQLLSDSRGVFYPVDEDGKSLPTLDRIHSADLLEGLNELEESPWHTWNDGNGLRPIDFYRRVIQHYGLHSSKDMRIDDKVRKGYERAWFEDTWSRFCPPKPPSPPIPDPLPATPATSLTDKEMQPDFDPQHDTEPWDPDPLQDNGCSDVAGNGAGVGATGPSAPLNPDDDPNFEPDRDFEVF